MKEKALEKLLKLLEFFSWLLVRGEANVKTVSDQIEEIRELNKTKPNQ